MTTLQAEKLVRLEDALAGAARREADLREALEKIRACSRSWSGTSWTYNKAGLIADAALAQNSRRRRSAEP